ncbi:transmembrane amino acid transporter protein-domain-containing protein [Zychaea mexicana]|uniref:transmembrane amino acid transporter protein-domain-containing protein n=1 Tax=Zychaea mexicana TaxID=64656 RepID=UPI0022FE5A71|nr:transmembrane amino acid transporter protein-domain-containing protein [Zychaea mexicana]KAI9499430.1 transmembrane amino acid transporter protein-domain-containing protein [Zychaea mexicana]
MSSSPIRVPSNTHPSRLPPNYGSLYPASSDQHNHQQDHYVSDASPRSFRDAVESFAGSYSRASILYVAENLNAPAGSIHEDTLSSEHRAMDEEERGRMSEDSKYSRPPIFDEASLNRTLSQRTAAGNNYHLFPSLSRHTTVASVLSQQILQHYEDTGGAAQGSTGAPLKSTFLQSVFNAVNVLIGIGILALPLAFRCGGWLFGSLIFFFCAAGTNYTAKIIVRCLDASSGAATYGDMGAAAFNESGRTLVSGFFIVELMTIGIAMVVLLGDGIQSFWPNVDLVTVRIFSFCALTPTMFLPMRKLALTSLVGILACICLLVTVLFDGFSKKTQPGSLLEPMETEIVPSDWYNVPLAFGLVMAGFSGHAVFPSIYRDMDDPKQYERMVDIAYLVTAGAYITMAVAGYLMFGLETMQEITQNLANTPGYYKIVTQFGIGLMVLTPLAKYGLMLNPVNLSLELSLLTKFEDWIRFHAWRKHLITASIRIIVSLVIVYTATVFPGFDRVVSLLGALFSFGISAIFPLLCYRRLFADSITWKESILNNLILLISTFMAVLGTIWSFLPNNI